MLYAGCDVSKDSLDIFFNGYHLHLLNSPLGFAALCKALPQDCLVVMEATGGYESACACALEAAGFGVAVVNPAEPRDFRKSLGRRAKTDLIDAEMLARFGEVRRLAPRPPQKTEALRRLVARRQDLVGMACGEKNRLEQSTGSVRKSVLRSLAWLKREISRVETLIAAGVAKDDELRFKDEVLQRQTGVGKVVSRTLLAMMPELGRVDRGKIASLAGLAPFVCRSGRFVGKAMISGGRAAVRKTLYVAALVATQKDPEFRTFRARLRERGKSGKQTIIACARKLLTRLNARVRDALAARWQEAKSR